MTVSFTKDETEWLLNFIYISTTDLEEDEYGKSVIDAANKIKEKIRIAQVKEILKRKLKK